VEEFDDVLHVQGVVGGTNGDAVPHFKRKIGACDVDDDVIGLFSRGGAGEEGALFDPGKIRVRSGVHFYRQLEGEWLD
jgi:hypothetical protein